MRYINSIIEIIWTYVKMRLGVNLYQEETWSYNGNNFKWQKTTQWYDDILQYLIKYTIFWNSTGIKTTRSIICFTWIVNYLKLIRKRKVTFWEFCARWPEQKMLSRQKEKLLGIFAQYHTTTHENPMSLMIATTWQDPVYCMNLVAPAKS